MFKSKKTKTRIDQQHIAMIEYAQARIQKKRRLYYHFIAFLFGSLTAVIINIGFKYGADIQPFAYPWVVTFIVFWMLLFLFHSFQVFVTHSFMGKSWEKSQLKHLVAKQEKRVEKLKRNLEKEALIQAKSERHQQEQSNCVLTIIAAVGTHNELGKDNQLIWHLSDDLKHFKNLTKGHHIIMGRKTFESMPKALPNRTNIVITRQKDYQLDGAQVVHSIAEAIDIAKNDAQPFIIGGGEIYEQALTLADRIELTRVHASFDADTFFPEINPDMWKEVWREEHPADDRHAYAFTFLRYQKISP